jgi:predicted nucleic acid-binding protein
MTNNRFVIDTNVIVSALIFPSPPPRLAFNFMTTDGEMLAIDEIFDREAALAIAN